MKKLMQIFVKTSAGIITLDTQPSATIEKVKNKIQKKTGIHRSNQELFFSNELLKDECILSDYNIHEKSTIDFKLLAPSLEKVAEAIVTLQVFIDSHTEFSSPKVLEAMVTLKAFADSQSCCASAIADLLKTKEETSERYNKIKTFCENLVREKLELTSVSDKQGSEIKELQVFLENVKTELENVKMVNGTLTSELGNVKTELESVKVVNETLTTELGNVKTELEDVKIFNHSLLEKVDGCTKLSETMENRIEKLSASMAEIKIKQLNK